MTINILHHFLFLLGPGVRRSLGRLAGYCQPLRPDLAGGARKLMCGLFPRLV